MVYSALFDNVYKALNLLKSINSAAWQWHFAAIRTTEVLHRFLGWLAIGDSITSYESQMLLLAAEHFAATVGMTSPFLASTTVQNMLNRTFLKLIWTRRLSGRCSGL
jgi:hypothetical protein